MRRKVGFVLIKTDKKGRYVASWRDHATGKYLRRVLPAADDGEAAAMAREINRHAAAETGFVPSVRGAGARGHTVSEAGAEAIDHTDASEETRKDYRSRFTAFIDWLNGNRPGVRAWADVTEAVLADFLEWCKRQGVSNDTIRVRRFVVRYTAGYMARTYPEQYRDVGATLKLRLPKQPKPRREDILSPAQLRALLGWLKENDPRVYVWACCQGLAGMREREAAYLRGQDIRPAEGLVDITTREAHHLKNAPSHRLIPVAPEVMVALAGWAAQLKRPHPKGYLFPPDKRFGHAGSVTPEAREGVYVFDTVADLWREAMDGARAVLELPPAFTPRKLRATFVTAMREAGADYADLQAYIGQVPETVLSRYYDRINMARLRVIADLADHVFR